MSEQKQPPVLMVMLKDDLQAVLNYLAARPYAEVSNLIEGVRKAQMVSPPAPEAAASEEALKA